MRSIKFPLKQLEFNAYQFTAVAAILRAVESSPAMRLERLSFRSNEAGAVRWSVLTEHKQH